LSGLPKEDGDLKEEGDKGQWSGLLGLLEQLDNDF